MTTLLPGLLACRPWPKCWFSFDSYVVHQLGARQDGHWFHNQDLISDCRQKRPV